MKLDLESVLGRLGNDRTVLGLLVGVLRIPAGDAVMSEQGGISGLTKKSPQIPSLDGVLDAGRPIEEIGAHLDSSELYIGVASAVRTALSLYDAHVEWAVGIGDLEDEHGRDAITRLVGLGLVAEGLCEGDSDSSTAMWLGTESGRAALAWFAAVEIGLAYSTEDDPIDGDKLIDLLDLFFDDAISAWTDLTSPSSLARSRVIVNNWTDVLCPAIAACAPHVPAIADTIRAMLSTDLESDHDALVGEAESIRLYLSLCARHLGESLNGLGAALAEAEPQQGRGVDDSLNEAMAEAAENASRANELLDQSTVQHESMLEKGRSLSEQQMEYTESRVKVSGALDAATAQQQALRNTGENTQLDDLATRVAGSQTDLSAAERVMKSVRNDRDSLSASVVQVVQVFDALPEEGLPPKDDVAELEAKLAEGRLALNEHRALLAAAKGQASADEERLQSTIGRATSRWKESSLALKDALVHRTACREDLSSLERNEAVVSLKATTLRGRIDTMSTQGKELRTKGKVVSDGAGSMGAALRASAKELNHALSQHKEHQSEFAKAEERFAATQQSHAVVRQMMAEAIESELVEVQRAHRLCVEVRKLRSTDVGLYSEQIDTNALVMAAVLSDRGGIKERLLAVRKERRAAGRTQTSSSKTVDAKLHDIEQSKKAHDVARKEKKGLLSGVSEAQEAVERVTKQLRKRQQRVTDTDSSVLSKDQVVQDLGEQITSTRLALAEIREVQLRWRAAEEELRVEEVKEVKRALSIARTEWAKADDALRPLRDAASALRTILEKTVSVEQAHVEKLEACRLRTQKIQDEHSVVSSRYDHGRKTAKAAVDMLRNNARRLEDSHMVRNEVQSTLDVLRSEQGSRKASIERSGEQILEGQRTEALAQATVEACTAAIEQTRAALTSTAQAIEIAHRNAEAVRIKKIAELGEEIRKAKVRLDVIRGTMVDAREDLEGLGVAEQRVLESQAKLTEGGHTIKMAMAEVNKRRTTHQKRQNAVSKVIEERSKGLGAVAPGIAGAQLTIRALESNLAQRVKRVERTLGRLIQLDSMIDMAQSQEDAAVEAVADIQSWVDRSRLALQRCLTERNEQPAALSSPPVLPKAKDVETQTQVDKLLSRTKKRTTQGMSEIIPDPGAALDVDEAATMQFIAPANVSQADSDAATAIFERTGSEPLDSEVDEADAATLIFSREELRAKIEEAEEDARTSMMSREEMQATRNRKNQED